MAPNGMVQGQAVLNLNFGVGQTGANDGHIIQPQRSSGRSQRKAGFRIKKICGIAPAFEAIAEGLGKLKKPRSQPIFFGSAAWGNAGKGLAGVLEND